MKSAVFVFVGGLSLATVARCSRGVLSIGEGARLSSLSAFVRYRGVFWGCLKWWPAG